MILAIDPGLDGALVLTDGTALQVFDVPTLTAGKGREVDGLAVAQWLDERSQQIRAAFLERVNAMPSIPGPNGKRRTMGAQSAFAFGRTDGLLHGLVVASLIPTTRVTPATWRKAMAVPKGKDGARARAKELLPAHGHRFDRKKDDGRADAALIALYGLRQLNAAGESIPQQAEIANV